MATGGGKLTEAYVDVVVRMKDLDKQLRAVNDAVKRHVNDVTKAQQSGLTQEQRDLQASNRLKEREMRAFQARVMAMNKRNNHEMAEAARKQAAAVAKAKTQLMDFATTAPQRIASNFSKMTGALVAPFKGLYELVRGMFIRLAAVTAIFASGAAIKSIVETGSYIEQQRAVLEALTGSAKEAGDMISWTIKKAEETPFEIKGLIEAITQLRSVGMDYKAWFEPIGTLAVMTGQSMEEGMDMAVRAVVRLRSGVTGEAMELLRRMKITRDDFMKNGIFFDARGQAQGSTEQQMNALLNIIRTKFPNVMEKLGNTSAVVFSNMKDSVTRFYLAIAGIDERGEMSPTGFLSTIKSSAQALLDWVDTNKAKINEWGASIGAVFVKAIDWVKINKDKLLAWGTSVLGILTTLFEAYKNILTGIVNTAIAFINVFTRSNISVKNMGDSVSTLLAKLRALVEWLKKHGETIGKMLVWTIAISQAAKLAKGIMDITIAVKALQAALNTVTFAKLAAMLAGIGPILAVAGIIAALYALVKYVMERPENERLRRSRVGSEDADRRQAAYAAARGGGWSAPDSQGRQEYTPPNMGLMRFGRERGYSSDTLLRGFDWNTSTPAQRRQTARAEAGWNPLRQFEEGIVNRNAGAVVARLQAELNEFNRQNRQRYSIMRYPATSGVDDGSVNVTEVTPEKKAFGGFSWSSLVDVSKAVQLSIGKPDNYETQSLDHLKNIEINTRTTAEAFRAPMEPAV